MTNEEVNKLVRSLPKPPALAEFLSSLEDPELRTYYSAVLQKLRGLEGDHRAGRNYEIACMITDSQMDHILREYGRRLLDTQEKQAKFSREVASRMDPEDFMESLDVAGRLGTADSSVG